MGELAERVQKNDGRMDLPTLTISAGSGWLNQEERFSGNIAGNEQKNYTLLKKGELAYNHGNSKLAKYGAVFELRTYEEALVPRVYHSFRMVDGHNPTFIEYLFATKLPDRELGKLISSGARMDGLLNIGFDEFFGINLVIPTVEEQDRIGAYFTQIDHLITLHQRKKYLFSIFETFVWEQRKLGDMMNVTSVKRIHQSDWTDSGVRFLRARDIVAASKNEEPEEYLYISKEKYEEYSAMSGKVDVDDILVTGVGTIGVPYLVENSKPLYFKDGNIIWFQNRHRVDGKFLYYSFIGHEIQDFINASAGTGTVGTYTIDTGKKTPIRLPAIEEQQMIGGYFSNLDHLITLHQWKCSKSKDSKIIVWEQRKVSSLAGETYGGGTPKTSAEEFWNGDIPWIQSSDITEHEVNYVEPKKYISEEAVKKSAAKLVPENSIAVVTRVGVGKLAIMRFPYATSQDFLSLTSLNTDLQFTAYLLYKKIQSESNAVQGTSIKGITKEELLNKNVMVPTLPEQEKIGDYFCDLDTLITLHQCKPNILTGLKDFVWKQRKHEDFVEKVTRKNKI